MREPIVTKRVPGHGMDTVRPDRTYRPARIRAFCARREDASKEEARNIFQEAFGVAPGATLESRSWIVNVAVEGLTSVGWDADQRVGVVLHGEIHDDYGETPSDVARRFRVRGNRLFKDLNGSFAALVLDKESDRLLVATDRLGTRRLFRSQGPRGHFITSDLSAQPTAGRDLDVVGVAWCLANNGCYAGRTYWEGVEILDRASVHELQRQGMRSTRYWTHARVVPDDLDEASLVPELGERLIAAVYRRVRDTQDVFISLSGGWDSTAIATILGDCLQATNVRTFTYRTGEAYMKAADVRAADDEKDWFVAERTARTLGFPIRVLDTYLGEGYFDNLRARVALCEAAGPTGREFDTWRQLSPDLDAATNPVLLVGNEVLGLESSETPGSVAEIWRSVRLRELEFPHLARRLFPKDLARRMREGLREDMDRVLARQPEGEDLFDLHDSMVHDHRVVNAINPWRERISNRFVTTRFPLLDTDVLDLVFAVPQSARRGKSLFLEAMRHLSPTFRGFRRADREASGQDVTRLLRAEADRFRKWITTSHSRLDELIPAEFGLKTLEQAIDPDAVKWTRAWASYGARRRLAGSVPGIQEPRPPMPASAMFRRWAQLRMALED